MSGTVQLIAGCAIVTFLIKAAGPVALGGRDLPLAFRSVIMVLAPALFAALVVTQTLAGAIGTSTRAMSPPAPATRRERLSWSSWMSRPAKNAG